MKEIMKKEAIRQANTVKKGFLSNLFLVKKGWWTKASVTSEATKCIYTIQSLENGRIAEPRCLLQKRDYLSKFHLKDAYFCVTLQKNSRKYVRYRWSGNLYEFLCLFFDFGPAPWIFAKLFRIPDAILLLTNLRMVIYLDDMLLVGTP